MMQKIELKEWNSKSVEVYVLREDLVHPYVNGNKWRKLKYNLEDFESSGKKTLVTFGGAFSNHLVATAAQCKISNIPCVGIVRGEEIRNPYLDFIRQCGMKLQFTDRTTYRSKQNEDTLQLLTDELMLNELISDASEIFIIPEGGANASAVKGAAEIMDAIPNETDFILCAGGTGATVAGLSQRLSEKQRLICIAVLKAPGYLEKEIERLGGEMKNVTIDNDHHFGGYAKNHPSLKKFCEMFIQETGIPVEHVYTGKMFYTLNDLITKDFFKPETKIVCIHTGGIFKF